MSTEIWVFSTHVGDQSMEKIYAGIGPRNTDPRILDVMFQLAGELEEMGWKLRSGHGRGADQAFEAGVKLGANKEIWLPNKNFNGAYIEFPHYHVSSLSPVIKRIAAEHHGGYYKCSPYIQRLFDRNVNILLGAEALKHQESAFVVYWQPEENKIDNYGGTNHSLRIARTYGIPTFNIELGHERQALGEFVNGRT